MMTLLIDTDPGIDDALALGLATRLSDVRIAAVTAVTGNLPSDRTFDNACRVLDLLGVGELPVGQGPPLPLSGDYPSDPFSHGPNGLAGAALPPSSRTADPRGAARMIVDTAAEHAGQLVILALGPLTNLAEALRLDPTLPSKVAQVVAVAGAFGETPYAWSQATGDNPVSEWNVFVDPEAAHEVIDSDLPFLAVGLDVSTDERINFRAGDLNRLRAAGTPLADFAIRVIDFVRERGYQSYCSLIDSLAVAAAVRPELIRTQRMRCDVETRGTLTRGMTVVERRRHHSAALPEIDVVTEVDYDRFLDLVTEALAR